MTMAAVQPIATLSVPVWPVSGRPPLGPVLAEWADRDGVTISVTTAEIHVRFTQSGATFAVDLQAIGQGAYEAVLKARPPAPMGKG
ncbi:MAG: hypothetical protein KF887_07000 [Paracoccaceae bacterium]|nr:MAG: hypothetical protein KF887_07000 [Paracoccaceae bacterium]